MCDCALLSHELVAQARNLGLPRCLPRSIISNYPLSLRIPSRASTNQVPLAGIRLRSRGKDHPGKARSTPTDPSKSPSDHEPGKYETLEGAMSPKSGSRDGSEEKESEPTGASLPSSFDFLELKRELEKEEAEFTSSDEEDLVQKEGLGSLDSGSGKAGGLVERLRGGRQVLRRSGLIAKQVISLDSARSLGFVSQLWVDTSSDRGTMQLSSDNCWKLYEDTKTQNKIGIELRLGEVEEKGGGLVGYYLQMDIELRSSTIAGIWTSQNTVVLSNVPAQSNLKEGSYFGTRSRPLTCVYLKVTFGCSNKNVAGYFEEYLWVVVLVEVRPTLLSGEIEKLLLEDVYKVGDVVLVQEESVMENELKMVGLDTLVGYNVVTSGQRNVGKVRGYTFNINSGAVESLELDSFGLSFVPSSLVSTYCLFVEDVLEVASDNVLVHEDAVSRVQRLTKGFWDARSVNTSRYEMEDHSNFGRRTKSAHSRGRSQKNIRSRKFPSKMRDIEDDWELPMDYQ